MPATFQRGKLRDLMYLSHNQKILPFIPETRLFTREWLSKMLHNHATLYIKPDDAAKGIGIIRIDRMGETTYFIRGVDTNHVSFHQDFDSTYKTVLRLKQRQRYIIQQGVTSTTQLGYPFDIRVHVVKANGVWTFGGMIGKVAKKKSIVTNACQGAVPTHIDTLLHDYRMLTTEVAGDMKSAIEELALSVAHEMEKKHTRWKEFGLDIGIDENNQLWVYEVNFKPGFILFRHIDQSAYLTICSLRRKTG